MVSRQSQYPGGRKEKKVLGCHRKYFLFWLLIIVLSIPGPGCAPYYPERYADRGPVSEPAEARRPRQENFQSRGLLFTQIGEASYYGPEFHGKRTSSGETFDMYQLTAAHNTLPFGSLVKVTNLKNNRSVVVRINDRGPLKKGRVIDLSYAAAQRLGFVGEGLARVKIEVVALGKGIPKTNIKN